MSKRNTYITGTLRADWKWNLSQVVWKKLQKGEMVFKSLGDISITKWKNKRDVCVISNAHVPTMMEQIQKETNRCSYLQQPYVGNRYIGSNTFASLCTAKNNQVVKKSWDSHHGNLSQQRLLYVC